MLARRRWLAEVHLSEGGERSKCQGQLFIPVKKKFWRLPLGHREFSDVIFLFSFLNASRHCLYSFFILWNRLGGPASLHGWGGGGGVTAKRWTLGRWEMALWATASLKWPMSDGGDGVGYINVSWCRHWVRYFWEPAVDWAATNGHYYYGLFVCCFTGGGGDTRSGPPDKLSVHTDLCVRITSAAWWQPAVLFSCSAESHTMLVHDLFIAN